MVSAFWNDEYTSRGFCSSELIFPVHFSLDFKSILLFMMPESPLQCLKLLKKNILKRSDKQWHTKVKLSDRKSKAKIKRRLRNKVITSFRYNQKKKRRDQNHKDQGIYYKSYVLSRWHKCYKDNVSIPPFLSFKFNECRRPKLYKLLKERKTHG